MVSYNRVSPLLISCLVLRHLSRSSPMVVSFGPGSILQFHPLVGGTILSLMFRNILQTRRISKLIYIFIDAVLTFFHGDKKVNAIREMQTPTDFTGVKRLCGMVQYMAAFLPDLANEMEQIRELTRFSLELVKRTRASISKGLRKLRS